MSVERLLITAAIGVGVVFIVAPWALARFLKACDAENHISPETCERWRAENEAANTNYNINKNSRGE